MYLSWRLDDTRSRPATPDAVRDWPPCNYPYWQTAPRPSVRWSRLVHGTGYKILPRVSCTNVLQVLTSEKGNEWITCQCFFIDKRFTITFYMKKNISYKRKQRDTKLRLCKQATSLKGRFDQARHFETLYLNVTLKPKVKCCLIIDPKNLSILSGRAIYYTLRSDLYALRHLLWVVWITHRNKRTSYRVN